MTQIEELGIRDINQLFDLYMNGSVAHSLIPTILRELGLQDGDYDSALTSYATYEKYFHPGQKPVIEDPTDVLEGAWQ